MSGKREDAHGCKSDLRFRFFLSWKTRYMMKMEEMPFIKKETKQLRFLSKYFELRQSTIGKIS